MGDERGIDVTITKYARLQFKDEFYAVLSGAQREIRHFFVEGGSFYLTRPLLLGEVPPSLLNPPLLRSGGLKAWPAGPVRANKLSP